MGGQTKPLGAQINIRRCDRRSLNIHCLWARSDRLYRCSGTGNTGSVPSVGLAWPPALLQHHGGRRLELINLLCLLGSSLVHYGQHHPHRKASWRLTAPLRTSNGSLDSFGEDAFDHPRPTIAPLGQHAEFLSNAPTLPHRARNSFDLRRQSQCQRQRLPLPIVEATIATDGDPDSSHVSYFTAE